LLKILIRLLKILIRLLKILIRLLKIFIQNKDILVKREDNLTKRENFSVHLLKIIFCLPKTPPYLLKNIRIRTMTLLRLPAHDALK
jgi:hypothetical protein